MKLLDIINEFNIAVERRNKYHINAVWYANYNGKVNRLWKEIQSISKVESVPYETGGRDTHDNLSSVDKYLIDGKFIMHSTSGRTGQVYRHGSITPV